MQFTSILHICVCLKKKKPHTSLDIVGFKQLALPPPFTGFQVVFIL